MTTPLLNPRALLTTVVTSLSSTPISADYINSAQNQPQTVNPPYDASSNPLKALPASHRALLATLHVLLPTGVLLQALDLLDRGLVVRVIEQSAVSKSEGNGVEGRVVPPQAHVHLPDSSKSGQLQGLPQIPLQDQDGSHPREDQVTEYAAAPKQDLSKEMGKAGKRNQLYLVRSSQAPKSRFKDSLSSTSASNMVYTVRVGAWNCSCAAFAFEAFPGGSLSHSPWSHLDGEDSDEDGDVGVEGREEWEFGGSSYDGKRETGKVPVCKHLLACSLAERWEGVLGVYVKERVVGREEMVGVGGEG